MIVHRQTNGSFNLETKTRHINGNLIDVALSVKSMDFQKRTYLQIFVKDITKKKTGS